MNLIVMEEVWKMKYLDSTMIFGGRELSMLIRNLLKFSFSCFSALEHMLLDVFAIGILKKFLSLLASCFFKMVGILK